jgi:heme/copper-type cytochrome/quinol oxidase subunit 4
MRDDNYDNSGSTFLYWISNVSAFTSEGEMTLIDRFAPAAIFWMMVVGGLWVIANEFRTGTYYCGPGMWPRREDHLVGFALAIALQLIMLTVVALMAIRFTLRP